MFNSEAIQLTMQALWLVLLLSAPPVIVAALVGLLIAFVQAATQIQEQTLSFAVKLVAVGVTIYLTARWMGGEIFNYTVALFDAFPLLVR